MTPHDLEDKTSTILIVDDDFSARLPIRFTLENAGYTVLEASSGKEALQLFAQHAPELVLLDIIMPNMDGFATCRHLRRIPGGEHTPIVMVTGMEDAETIVSAFDAGATDFISKPINMLILGYRVRYWLRSGAILADLEFSRRRLSKAQQIARLGHWELYLPTNRFQMTTNNPALFGIDDPTSFEALFARIVEEDRPQVRRLFDQARNTGQSFSTHYRISLPNSEERIIFNQGEVVPDRSGMPDKIMGIMQDITKIKHTEDQLHYLSFYDNLTGLANMSMFRDHWHSLRPKMEQDKKKVAILFVDLDHFKQVNDTLGHQRGDRVLVTVAERLKSALRQTDVISRMHRTKQTPIISRMGGDKFTILAPNFLSLDHIAKLAERITMVIKQPLHLNGQDIALSASIGISVYPDDSDDIDVLLRNADTAMYAAKEKGRDNYQFFQAAMNEAAMLRFQLGNSLRRALENNEFVLYYQPQFSSTTGKMTGAEALIRWIDPQSGMVPPFRFLPFAEESGLIYPLNEWVLETACVQTKRWVEAGLFTNCRMAINISGQNLNFKSLAARIMEVLNQTGLEPRYLELELTERVIMENTEEAVDGLRQFEQMGIAIAIDDFGTGYSSLSQLQSFPLTTLKIDRSFVHNIAEAGRDLTLIESIVKIAKSFQLKVVAEGVETEEELEVLQAIGCDEIQGYLFSKPIPQEEFQRKMEEGLL
ncbi:MAG: putative bifunctional diguanylate cyclase/phosphodiesterase [Desulfobulbus sp.]|jgi:diguanylate cyclase (GGDEF)-like protein